MFIWTPVIMGYGSLKEIEQDWSINDIADALSAMEMKSELEKLDIKE